MHRTMTGEAGFMMLRRIQIILRTFNTANGIVIFSMKHATMWNCIFTGYIIIAHFWENPLVGGVIVVIFVDCFVVYAVVYEKAFSIPTNAEDVKKTLLLCHGARQSHSHEQIRQFRKCIGSVPNWGISVGGFHYLERTSTPNFVDFVVQNVVGALISFR